MNIGPFLKTTLKKTFHLFQVDIRKYNLYHSDDILLQTIIEHFDIQTVIDVGGNEGQYAKGLIEHGYKGRIYSFEPIPSVFEILKRKSGKHSKWSAFNFAIGSKEGELIINVSENFASSSLFNVTEASLVAEPRTRITHQEKIKMITIDSFASGQSLDEHVMLKLDVQGYELEALKGSLKSLPKIKAVQAELSFVSLYEGAPLFQDVFDFLNDQGFEIFTIIPGFRNGETGQLLQADGIFVRTR